MKLLVVDNHEIVRKGVVAIFNCGDTVEEVLEAATVEEAMKIMTIDKPDMVMVEVTLGEKNGIDFIEQVKKEGIEAKFIIFTSSGRKGDFERAKDLTVDGYIMKNSNVEDVVYAIRSIERGRKFYDNQLTQDRETGNRDKVLEGLTDREKEIFMEIGKGLSNSQIAEKLYISENTVKKHISSLLAKLELSRRTEVALYATKLWRRKGDF